MTKYYARVGVLAAALIAGSIATLATSAGPKPPGGPKPPKAGCKTIFESLVLNVTSGAEIAKSEGKVCRETLLDGNVTVGAKLEIETGSEVPRTWAVFLGDQVTEQSFFIGNVTTGAGKTEIKFDDTICMGPCPFPLKSFRAPFLSAVGAGQTYITGFRLP